MSLYGDWLLPHLTHGVCAGHLFAAQRAQLVPEASGIVLEIGFGSGLNLPFYDPSRVDQLFALEPSATSLRLAAWRIAAAGFAIETLPVSATAIPLPDASVDTVLVTFTLCTIPELLPALAEMRRVLRPSGRLLFCEHGLAPEAAVQRWQKRLDPVWSRFAGGCHLNRAIPDLLVAGGFTIKNLQAGYISPWRAGSYVYRGSACV